MRQATTLSLRLADPEARYAAVRLRSDLPLSDGDRAFRRRDGEWVLELAPPPIARLEYELELVHADGERELACDAGNPHRAPGAFGEKSVLLLPGYRPPAWVETAADPGATKTLAVASRPLRADVRGRIWSPADAPDDEPLPLLVAHDGPELDELAELTRYASAMVASGALPPHRLALLAPGHRAEWYSASAAYARALCTEVLPALRQVIAVAGTPVGMGASLGALAMLHAQRRFPGALAALFLRSGSFFVRRFDAHESRFVRFERVVRFVRETLRGGGRFEPIPAALTCGAAEENVHNNRLMAHALRAQGYGEATLQEVPDMHNYTSWRDALDPHLTELLARAWSP